MGLDGSFKITLGGQSWLEGSEYRLGTLSVSKGTLHLLGDDDTEGTDVLGPYHATSLRWGADQNTLGDVLMETTFRVYKHDSPWTLASSCLSNLSPKVLMVLLVISLLEPCSHHLHVLRRTPLQHPCQPLHT